jgi:hypothetical protein
MDGALDVRIAPESAARRGWTATRLREDGGWLVPAGAEERADAERLAEWARAQADPVAAFAPGIVETPALERLADRVGEALRGTGVARVVALDPGLDDLALRMAYLATGLAGGPSLDNYGRLFDVVDRGEDHRRNAVPVSMTRESTSFHTDSSARDTCPDRVGLLCLAPAAEGGESLVSSAVAVHEELRRRAPELLRALYRPYMRDVVTPGTERNLEAVRANRFPIYAHDERRGELVFRYMRYWIERAHEMAGEPLAAEERAAFDLLDALLADERHALSFTLARGEMLWVDNRLVAHNRTGFRDDPAAPRRLVRMWTQDGRRTCA